MDNLSIAKFSHGSFSNESLISLLNLCFFSDNYIGNFPQIFEPGQEPYFYGVYDSKNNQLIAFCAVYPYLFTSPHFLRAYGVGSVCSHPDFRGQGIVTKLLDYVAKDLQKQDADFLFLFSEKRGLYENLGFELCGKSYLHKVRLKGRIEKLSDTRSVDNEFYSEQTRDLDFMSQCKVWYFIIQYQQKSEPILSFLEFCKILQIKNMSVYFLENKNEITAVCFLDKGDDFKKTIHGLYYKSKNDLKYLIENVLKETSNSELFLYTNEDIKNLSLIEDSFQIPTMFFKPLNPFSESVVKRMVENNEVFVGSLQGV